MRKAFLLLALLAAASASGRDLVRLTSPAHPVLSGGTRAIVAWEPTTELPRDVEEWEAFLSVDGGKHYAIRITPHLDAHHRSFAFDVPNVAASDARILLRIGDEEREHVIAIPQPFAVVPDVARVEVRIAKKTTQRRGESALFGDDHVDEWVTSDLTTHVHRDAAELARVTMDAPHELDAATPVHESIVFGPTLATAAETPIAGNEPPHAPTFAAPILLLTTRLNI